MRLTAKMLRYSNTVGGGVQLLDSQGRPRFMVAFIGMQEGITKEESQVLGEQFAHYVNNHDVIVPERKEDMNDRLGPVISKMNPPNPWVPEDDKVVLAVLGKLGEEASELSVAIYRCIIQGVNEKHPVTGKLNREWLTEELVDVMAGCAIVQAHFGLDAKAMEERMKMKLAHKLAWHKLIEEALAQ